MMQMNSQANPFLLNYSVYNERTGLPDIHNEQIMFLMALEENIETLYKQHGAVKCPGCNCTTIHVFPFFDRRTNLCVDCTAILHSKRNNELVS